MRTISLFLVVLLVAATAVTDARAGLLNDLWSYATGSPSGVYSPPGYPGRGGSGGYQYQVTYYGPSHYYGGQQVSSNQYVRHAESPRLHGNSAYQPSVRQTAREAYPGVAPGQTRSYSYASRQGQVSRANPGHGNRTTYAGTSVGYRQGMPRQQPAVHPYSYAGQPSPSYQRPYTPQHAMPAGPSYYSNPYQYAYQGWNAAGACSVGKT